MYIEKTEDNSLLVVAKEATYEVFFHGEGNVVAEITRDRVKGFMGADIHEKPEDLFIKSLNVNITPEDTLETAFEKCNNQANKLINSGSNHNKLDKLLCSYTIDFLDRSHFIRRASEISNEAKERAEEILNSLFEFKVSAVQKLFQDEELSNITKRAELLNMANCGEITKIELFSEIINEKVYDQGYNPIFNFITESGNYSSFVNDNPFLINFRHDCLDNVEGYLVLKDQNDRVLLVANENYISSISNDFEIVKFSKSNEFEFLGQTYPATKGGLDLLKVVHYDSDIKIYNNIENKETPEMKNKNKLKI